jgi:hypothetical protein
VIGKAKCPVHGKRPAVMIGAIDDKRKLLGWLAATEHKNLVLRIVDVLELRNDHQDWLIYHAAAIRMVTIAAGSEGSGWRKGWLLNQFPNGWIILPFDKLLTPLNMDGIKKLQEIIFAYRGIRLEKGEPNKIEPCEKCNGTCAVGGRPCKHCDGEGQIITFLETSDEERQMMKGDA